MTTSPDIAPAAALADRRLGLQDLDRLVALHEDLHRRAANPSLFVRESRDFFAHHLGPGGHVLALETPSGSLACYSILGLPEAGAPENFGRDLGLDPADLARVCHLDGTGVLPEWRGHRFQRLMTQRRIDLAHRTARPIILSTAAPANPWSIANLLSGGLRVVALVEKYGATRLILRRGPGTEQRSVPRPGDAPRAALGDSAGPHRELLADGWQGVAVDWTDRRRPQLIYARAEAGR